MHIVLIGLTEMRILPFQEKADALALELSLFKGLRTEPEAVRPPSNNMGGTYLFPPYPVSPVEPAQRVKVDWLAFTSGLGSESVRVLVQCLFPDVVMDRRSHGMPGYPDSMALTVGGVPVGLIGYGAAHGRDFVSITGKGCAMWSDDFMPHVLDVLQTAEAKLTRIDLALDFYHGEVDHDRCLAAYHSNLFKLPKSPKNPMLSQVGSTRDGLNLGRTIYVGSRKGAKLVRCYEKGLEVFARLPEQFREACTEPGKIPVGMDGQLMTEPEQQGPQLTIAESWFRVEIEFKAADGLLPLDYVINRDMYYAGAYPFCAQILGLSDGIRPPSLKSLAEIDNEKMIMNARHGYGNAVHTWRKCGFSDKQIVDSLDTGVLNQRLVKAGVLSSVKAVDDWDIPF